MQIILDLASETLNKESWEFKTFNSLLYSVQLSVLEMISQLAWKSPGCLK